MLPRSSLLVPSLAIAVTLVGCGSGGRTTTLVISNKITSLPAGQSYRFELAAEHDQGKGATWVLNGQGTLVPFPPPTIFATYIAPPAPPTPNSVTVTATAANGSGVSDSDSFTITPAPGPVVSISPASFTVAAGGPPFTLNISVTQDNPSDVLSGGASGSPACGGVCGSFGPFAGTPGGGTYTVQFLPPTTITQQTIQSVSVFSSLADSTAGTAIDTINPR
jgi:hypothetical protein